MAMIIWMRHPSGALKTRTNAETPNTFLTCTHLHEPEELRHQDGLVRVRAVCGGLLHAQLVLQLADDGALCMYGWG